MTNRQVMFRLLLLAGALPICVGAAHTQEHPCEAGPATTLGTLLHFYLLSYERYALLDHVILVIPLTIMRPINAAVTNVDDVGTVLLHL